MAWWFVEKIEEETGFLNDIWFFEEAHFWLHDQVNSRSNVYWGTVMPDSVHQRPLHLVKCKARCAMSKHGIIGSFWFEDVDCIAMTSDWARHWSWKEELSKRRTMVSAGSGYQSSCKWVPWVSDKPLQWERLVDTSASTGLHIPWSKQTRFLLLWISQGQTVQGQPWKHLWAETSNHRESSVHPICANVTDPFLQTARGIKLSHFGIHDLYVLPTVQRPTAFRGMLIPTSYIFEETSNFTWLLLLPISWKFSCYFSLCFVLLYPYLYLTFPEPLTESGFLSCFGRFPKINK